MKNGDSERLAVNVIRGLAMDGVEKASSGHPGMPMGAADMAYVLWYRYLKHSPSNPDWPDRDRFILSAGHGSMLLYSLLHLFGYRLPLEELKRFRQWGSSTPGHPERGCAPGVEVTTGPLGQGFANGVGMALAERILAGMFNDEGDAFPVDHYTYAIVSDGDLMEGISSEAASLAGFLGLGKLVYLYDSNRITIEGETDLAFKEDVGARFKAYGWGVLEADGHDLADIARAIEAAREDRERPTLIICRTHIAYGSPNAQDTAASHGAPLGREEVGLAKEALGLPRDAEFYIPGSVAEHFQARRHELDGYYSEWSRRFADWRRRNPDKAALWDRVMAGELPAGLEGKLPVFPGDKALATRNASGEVIQALAAEMPEVVGGSADLAPSNKTLIKGAGSIAPGDFSGRNIHFGVREHAMGGILNGMACHGGLRVYGGTFLVFSDYMRPSIRLAAMMGIPVVYVFTHDSIFVGEDGPTHQPIEHVASLRAIPNLTVIRPADATETAWAWLAALERKDGPTALILTRQGLPPVKRDDRVTAESVRRGAYVVRRPAGGKPAILLIASGSELAPCLEACEILEGRGYGVMVVNMASWELFEAQPADYRNEVIPPEVEARLVVEAGSPMGWERYAGARGRIIGIDRFGASAPYRVLAEKFGFTADSIVREAEKLLE